MSEPRTTEVMISGGGLVGLTLGIALAKAGIAVTIVDASPTEAASEPAFDGRASSIAPDVRAMLETLGVWAHLAEAQPVTDIVVSGGTVQGGAAPLFLHVDAADAGAALFHMVENRHLRAALTAAASAGDALTIVAPQRIGTAAVTPAGVTATLANGDPIAARLLVAADGRDSALRAAMGLKVTGWAYPQWGIVTTVAHERPHDGAAQEYFLPGGPFAILPLTGNRASLVWTDRADLARDYLALPDADFAAEIAARFTDYLGQVAPVGPRWGYPLSFQLARDYVAPRFALVGDAAHVIHPLAGQGLNLGLRDVATLAEAIVDADRLGLDLGASAPLEAYQRRRRPDAAIMAAMTDGLNRLFSNDSGVLRAVRDTGLGAVNALQPLRRFFARAAAGAAPGDQPRLLRGEAL